MPTSHPTLPIETSEQLAARVRVRLLSTSEAALDEVIVLLRPDPTSQVPRDRGADLAAAAALLAAAAAAYGAAEPTDPPPPPHG